MLAWPVLSVPATQLQQLAALAFSFGFGQVGCIII
jgi:hypothetical protein